MTNSGPKIVVYGLWHLGCVTAASMASQHFDVWGLDSNAEVIRNLKNGKAPIFEPGLEELIGDGLRSGRLKFTSNLQDALSEANVIRITFDTPVDEDDRADFDFVRSQLDAAFPYIKSGAIILISSQVPVGFTDSLRKRWQVVAPGKTLIYSYSPENLRLGKALKSFRADDRIVIGLDGEEGLEIIQTLYQCTQPSHR